MDLFFHQSDKVIEQWRHIVWPRTCLWMTLESECRFVAALNALQRAIEQRFVGSLKVRRQAVTIDRETVVLTGYQNLAVGQVLHRVVGAMMTQLHLDGAGTTGER